MCGRPASDSGFGRSRSPRLRPLSLFFLLASMAWSVPCPAGEGGVERVLEEARTEGLPLEVLVARMKEGRAKGVDESRVVEVMRQELTRLRMAKRLLEARGWAVERPRLVLLSTAMAVLDERTVEDLVSRSEDTRDFGVLRRRLGVAMFLASLGVDGEGVRRTMRELESSGDWFASDAGTHRLKRMLLEAHRAGEDVGRPGPWMSRWAEGGEDREGRREGLRRGEGHRWRGPGNDPARRGRRP